MKIFYERIETETEIKIITKPHALYIFIGLSLLYAVIDHFISIPGEVTLSDYAGMTIIALLFLRLIVMRKVRKELFTAMKTKQVKFTGSRLSFTNPIVATIPK
ncbi:hypothetical protein [Motilimonas eburnea]|uniref:hypothetical protein n=1 Tax=Motilimonas eburnea TaxID=1737488 RepID=UPI001E43EDCF|nr:hypothetical protein [Motilimonas eburnea]MCE2571211.1 hypothetical protein [Motilimonas eburnea]